MAVSLPQLLLQTLAFFLITQVDPTYLYILLETPRAPISPTISAVEVVDGNRK